jgi:hypothetical protein
VELVAVPRERLDGLPIVRSENDVEPRPQAELQHLAVALVVVDVEQEALLLVAPRQAGGVAAGRL